MGSNLVSNYLCFNDMQVLNDFFVQAIFIFKHKFFYF